MSNIELMRSNLVVIGNMMGVVKDLEVTQDLRSRALTIAYELMKINLDIMESAVK